MSARAASAGHYPLWLVVAGLCGLYLVLELVYIARLPLVMDEFQQAATVARLPERLPYRDHQPYKTVLGYYLQLPVLASISDSWRALLAVKVEMALLTALVVGACAGALRRHYAAPAIVLGLALLVAMSTFLERSASLRVDMLTALAGLVSLVLLLRRRAGLAGLAAGVSFLVSQKGIYYAFAGNVAFIAWWVLARSRRQALAWLRFNATAATAIAIYIAVWATVSSVGTVVTSTFLANRDIVFEALYEIKWLWWSQTLQRNPLFYLLAVLALTRLRGQRRGQWSHTDVALLSYGGAMIAACLWHKQPWPYFFVLLIPTLFVMVVATLDREMSRWPNRSAAFRRVLVAVLLVVGFAWPLSRVPKNLALDSGFQREMVRLGEAVLREEETYLAGVSVLYRHEQAVQSLTWLDRRRLGWLASLDPDELGEIVRELERTAPTLLLDNYRMQNVPAALAEHLGSNFRHLWGNLFARAIRVDAAMSAFTIQRSDQYRVGGFEAGAVRIDGRAVRAGGLIKLSAGPHSSSSDTSYFLTLWPAIVEETAKPEYRIPRPFFSRDYDY